MYFEEIANYTRDHLLSHMTAYLDLITARHTTDKYKLVVPHKIDASPVLGAEIPVDNGTLPQYAIDIQHKIETPTAENMWNYTYDGVISFMTGANSPKATDVLAKRHAALLEQFVRDHLRFHLYKDPLNQFEIVGLMWNNTDFGGPILLERLNKNAPEFWIEAGSLSLTWQVWEDGPGDVSR